MFNLLLYMAYLEANITGPLIGLLQGLCHRPVTDLQQQRIKPYNKQLIELECSILTGKSLVQF